MASPLRDVLRRAKRRHRGGGHLRCLGLSGGHVLPRATGTESQQQLVQLEHHPGVILTPSATSVDQNPQHREPLVVDYGTQAGHAGADQRDRVRVGGVGVAAMANTRALAESLGGTSATSSPSASTRFATCGPMPFASLDSPASARPLPSLTQPLLASRSLAKRPPPRICSAAAITSTVTERLCGSMPMTTRPDRGSARGGLGHELPHKRVLGGVDRGRPVSGVVA
jgi:hypothetical protein